VKKTEPDKTRDQVARRILEFGPATAVELAEKLAITPAGIRRHLDSLIAEGILTCREPYQSATLRSRGRPSKVFLMTDQGREKFEHSYDEEKAKVLAKLLTKEGYAATTDKMGNGEEICQHHCPIAHVAAEFPQLCEAETAAFSRILGTHVQRLATIAHGDGVCTTFIPSDISQISKTKMKEGAR